MTDSISIATWNVNSIKARLQHTVQWLRDTQTDIVLLQELKCEDAAFPLMEIEELGYNVATHGQKTYNGVAILSKFPIDDISRGLPGDDTDVQARYIEATISLPGSAIQVASVYVPNGQEVDSDKFAYKLKFFKRLYAYLQAKKQLEEPLIIGGDYNVGPAAIDVYAPKQLDGTVCYHPNERAAFRALINLGYTEAFRALNPDKQQYSWWDYRGGGYPQNKGLRIDNLLCNAYAADHLQQCWIDETPRGWDKPSDHAPVVAEFVIATKPSHC